MVNNIVHGDFCRKFELSPFSDKSPLLLCQCDDIAGDSLTDSSSALDMLPTTSLCINSKDIQVYKGKLGNVIYTVYKILGTSL